ncbi:MAG: F0F1 ATP synthase subunit B [bacterium]|nr:F0F1 ATP synthase subunit B [bacterium]
MSHIIIPQPGSIIWTFATFAIVLFVLWKFAWGPILKGLQAREDGIRKDIDDAKKSRLDAQELLEKYQKQLDESRKEAQRLISEANARSEALFAEKIKEVATETDALREKAKAEIELARQKAVQELRQEVVEIAISAAAKVIGKTLKTEDHASLIQQEIDGLN